ncbi:hypothetical protein Mp_8g05480 [Marchantia polymorpha subsp. ruderalis]|uniref:Uncharacterized protein n=1 Tax=Marchantia polymorpha TaxID=3197 RepID=A0A2R6WKF2_MARPO|nr:hypothetical protein MARPO_0081s0049 [Marchantia polymorpha]BBN18783.1 hypothetical protein Mp_8g05480 [Marchantia polymorpha subsp. ruderalis]|eukprot:PTQ34322.1 hypothetical protein MARPO_0081s0049 [Marchantia polymorpha]
MRVIFLLRQCIGHILLQPSTFEPRFSTENKGLSISMCIIPRAGLKSSLSSPFRSGRFKGVLHSPLWYARENACLHLSASNQFTSCSLSDQPQIIRHVSQFPSVLENQRLVWLHFIPQSSGDGIPQC